jgi:hypothetical protein
VAEEQGATGDELRQASDGGGRLCRRTREREEGASGLGVTGDGPREADVGFYRGGRKREREKAGGEGEVSGHH